MGTGHRALGIIRFHGGHRSGLEPTGSNSIVAAGILPPGKNTFAGVFDGLGVRWLGGGCRVGRT